MRDEPHSSIARIPELRWLQQMIMERALTRGDYLLSGGARSDYYIDKFRLFSDPQILRRIARLFAPIVADMNPDLIGGTELGGVILATAVSQMTSIPMIIVRKAPKEYGAFADEYVEGGPFAARPARAAARRRGHQRPRGAGRQSSARRAQPQGHRLRGDQPRTCAGQLADLVLAAAERTEDG